MTFEEQNRVVLCALRRTTYRTPPEILRMVQKKHPEFTRTRLLTSLCDLLWLGLAEKMPGKSRYLIGNDPIRLSQNGATHTTLVLQKAPEYA